MIVAFSNEPEPQIAVGDTQKGTVALWDLVADQQIQILQVAEPNQLLSVEQSANSMSLSPDGQKLAILKNDATVETWDVNSGQRLLSLPGPSVLGSATVWFSMDGKHLVVADCTGLLTVRDAETGAKLRSFSTGAACPRGVAFSPDGKWIGASSGGRETKIWDFETGQEVVALPGSDALQFTPDGAHLVVMRREDFALGNDMVQVYALRLEELVALAKSRLTRSLTIEECQQYLHLEQCPPTP